MMLVQISNSSFPLLARKLLNKAESSLGQIKRKAKQRPPGTLRVECEWDFQNQQIIQDEKMQQCQVPTQAKTS